ncbi:uncharacterized protein [Atheta coriaria]|uniref:uncharacterized protein isoform X1 n=2 Tax=Dalotia coriaria TaxID=877792 RepID=UPI0031F38EB5
MLLKVFVLSFACFLCIQETQARIPPHIAKLLPPELIELIMSLRNVCTKKVGLVPDDIEHFDINPDSPQPYKCYMECMMSAAKWLTPKGKINYKKMLDDSYPDIKQMFEKVVDKCRDIQEGDNCATAFNFNLCIARADPENYFLP